MVYKDHTHVVGETKRNPKLAAQVSRLQSALEITKRKNQDAVAKYCQERLARLVGKSAVVRVGGTTESETREIKDRIDDSVHAAQAALQDGVVVGGGAALIHSSKVIPALKAKARFGEKIGLELVEKACRMPCNIIASNAGWEGSYKF